MSEAAFLIVAVDPSLVVRSVAGRGTVRGWQARPRPGISATRAFADAPELERALRSALRGEPLSLILHPGDQPVGVTAVPCEGGGALALIVDLEPLDEANWRARQLHILLAQLPASVWTTDRQLVIRHLTGSLPQRLGYLRRNIVGKTIAEFIGTDDPLAPANAHHRAALQGITSRFQLRARGRTFDISVEPLLDAHGSVSGTVGLAVDATEQMEREAAMAHAASLLRATLESTADGILVVDHDGKMAAFNQRFAELWRLPHEIRQRGSDEDALAWVLDQLEDPQAFLARVRELYAHQDMESYDVLRFKDGRVFERYSRPQLLGEYIAGRVWSFRDITERERLLRRALFLADASRLLASLDLERAAEAVAHLAVPYLGECCMLDLLDESGAARRMFAIGGEHLCALGELPQPSVGGHAGIFETRGRSWMAVPLSGRDRQLGVLSFAAPESRQYGQLDLDVAEELGRRMALALDNARLYAGVREALQARDEFLSVAAHELRGPATSLKLSVQSIRAGEVPPSLLGRTLDICDRAVRKIARFIDELLDVSRARAGVLQLDFEDVDLAEVTREAATHLQVELSRSGSTLSLDVDSEVIGRWDRNRVEQVITNLLGNAIKFGGGKPIDVSVSRHDHWAQLKVRDRGIGIPRERQAAVFEPFERAVSARHYGGLGLGLYICRSIVDALGGRMGVESQIGQGSTFTVELPFGGRR
jgi:PAS domain S-box-containing protein